AATDNWTWRAAVLLLAGVDKFQVELPELGVEEFQFHEPDARRIGAARGERDRAGVAVDRAGEVDHEAIVVDPRLAFAPHGDRFAQRPNRAFELALTRLPGPRVAGLDWELEQRLALRRGRREEDGVLLDLHQIGLRRG